MKKHNYILVKTIVVSRDGVFKVGVIKKRARPEYDLRGITQARRRFTYNRLLRITYNAKQFVTCRAYPIRTKESRFVCRTLVSRTLNKFAFKETPRAHT